MAKFTDLFGREWSVGLDVWGLRVVREATGFEVAKLLNDEMKRLKEIAADPELFVRVLHLLCAEPKGTEEELAKGLAGDPLEAAFDAFLGAFADFYPSHRRAVFRAMAKKEKELATILTETAAKEVEEVDAPALIRMLKDSAGGSPGSSESIPPG